MLASRRDIKKALQHFGRTRPDIVLQLPAQLLQDLASQQYHGRQDKKARLALERMRADHAPLQASAGSTDSDGQQQQQQPERKPHVTGRASTQDVVRAMWCLADTLAGVDGDGDEAGGAAAPAASAAAADPSAAGAAEAAGRLFVLLVCATAHVCRMCAANSGHT